MTGLRRLVALCALALRGITSEPLIGSFGPFLGMIETVYILNRSGLNKTIFLACINDREAGAGQAIITAMNAARMRRGRCIRLTSVCRKRTPALAADRMPLLFIVMPLCTPRPLRRHKEAKALPLKRQNQHFVTLCVKQTLLGSMTRRSARRPIR